MTRGLLISLLLAASFCFSPARAADNARVAAMVNQVPITESELDGTLEVRRNQLHALIERSLMIQNFQANGGTIPKSYIDERVAEIIKTDYGGDADLFISTLGARGVSLTHYRQELADNAIITQVRIQEDERIAEKVKSIGSEEEKAQAAASLRKAWLQSLQDHASIEILDKTLCKDGSEY